MRPRSLLPLAAMLIGCSLLTSYDESKLTEDTFARCRDRTDNDGNGLADCDDPSCAAFDICRELTPDSCSDGKDNDGDALVDCADPGCAALPGVCVEQTVQACTDGKDNDSDGRTDCKDPDCLALDVCRELSAADCSDGQDNDRDGLTDCEDFDCYQQPSCCTINVPAFTGDTFTYNAPCKILPCTKDEPTCCQSGYQMCNAFDPSRWVVWGLPRPMQENGAFVTNEPCGCESSGVVSVEDVPLSQGTTISFQLSVTNNDSLVCGGLTVSETFPDDKVQCAGTSQPQLLLGICLRSSEDGDPRLVAMVDGVPQSQAPLPGGGPVTATIAIKEDGVAISAGSLDLQTPSPGSALASALVLVHGSGTGGRLDSLTVTAVRDDSGRCRAPGSWYRHLARGEPVVRRDGDLVQASDPTVVFQPELKSYVMLFSGKGKGDAWDGIYAATSPDGLSWTVSSTPVFPASPTDTTFGRSQGSPSLLYRNGQYHVWYTREDESGGFVQRAIAHATSADAKLWTPATGPVGQIYVLEPGTALEWDSLEVRSPSVVAGPDGNLLMWYTGTRAEAEALPGIGVASSKDGSTWSRLQNGPVLAPEPGTADLACADPAVVYDPASKTYMMWYTYRAFGQQPSIRYAVSPNGLAWSSWPTTVFAPGALGTFDERGTVGPSLLFEAPLIKLWYTGLGSSGVPQIGYAENRGQR